MAEIDDAVVLMQGKNYSGSGDWLDESGNGHDATPNNTSFDTDHFVLNGTTAYLEITTHADFEFGASDDLTVMIVFEVDDVSTGSQFLFDTKIAGSNNKGYNANTSASGGATVKIADGSVQSNDTFASAISDDTKYSVCLVRNTGDDDIECFVDGTGTGTPTTDATTASLTNHTNLFLGCYSGTSGPGGLYLGGFIYALAIWDRALSDSNVSDAHDELFATDVFNELVATVPGTAAVTGSLTAGGAAAEDNLLGFFAQMVGGV